MEQSSRITQISALLIFCFLVSVVCGCSGADSQTVNRAAMTFRTSPSVEKDRIMARNSLKLLTEQDKNYLIGPGDLLEVNIFEWVQRDENKVVEVRVEESGQITLPVINALEAGGLTVSELEDGITQKLLEGRVIVNPRVSVIIKEFRSKRIAVVGKVQTPGEYTLRQNVITLLDALAQAGGLSEEAGYELHVIRTRKKPGEATVVAGAPGAGRDGTFVPEVLTVDLIELMEEGNLELNVVLRHGDVVNVPEARQFYVVGFVRKPGGFFLKRPMTVLQAIAMAEGLMEREASPSHCALKRITNNKEEVISLDLVAISRGEQPNIYLLPDDIIDVRQTTTKFVALEVLNFVTRVFHIGYTYRLGDDE